MLHIHLPFDETSLHIFNFEFHMYSNVIDEAFMVTSAAKVPTVLGTKDRVCSVCMCGHTYL